MGFVSLATSTQSPCDRNRPGRPALHPPLSRAGDMLGTLPSAAPTAKRPLAPPHGVPGCRGPLPVRRKTGTKERPAPALGLSTAGRVGGRSRVHLARPGGGVWWPGKVVAGRSRLRSKWTMVSWFEHSRSELRVEEQQPRGRHAHSSSLFSPIVNVSQTPVRSTEGRACACSRHLLVV